MELRAYALPVVELEHAPGATGAGRARFEVLARRALAPPPTTRGDRLGPVYTRVPGARVLRPDDPTPADLATFLHGRPVAEGRAAATWRLVEALAAGLARSSTTLSAERVPAGLLAPLALAVPPVPGLVVGWCPSEVAAEVAGLAAWSATLAPGLDVVLLGRDTA